MANFAMMEVRYPSENFMSSTLRRTLNFTYAFLTEHADEDWWQRQQHIFDPEEAELFDYAEISPGMLEGLHFS